ncbi:cell wall / vacuolar inhibitor of fructosidase 2-like [Solanum stenotomum]|uniref:cell wall / vacuolar inhibitor of fructosidase 2-like n=1 Tax=Solanum stenotomum TaxID=172797 RepID=UPI0020D0A66B|nr:cell wall / vacuolar inhibitor of fructosidase 2-like [Solanum stenotomum]
MNSLKALTVIFMLFFSFVTFSSGDLIEDVCRTSSDFKVCINALRADPKSSSADKKGLVRILLQQCLTKAKNIYNEVANLLEQAKEHVLIQCLQICKENYDSAIDVATTAIKDFDANDFFGAKITVSAVVSCADTCEESFTEPPIRTSPTKSKSEDLMNFVGLTLSLVKQFSN